MDIGKARDNFDKNRKPKCFNCNVYGHMANDYQKLKKEQDTRKQNNKGRELNVQAIKTQTGKELWLQILVDTGCIQIGIEKQLVKKE